MHEITKEDLRFCDCYTRKLCRKLGQVCCDDAIQAGREGMVIASHKYDPEKSDNFKGYSTWWIRQCLYRDHFGIGKNPDALKKSVVFLDDVCYMDNNKTEKRVANRDLARKCLLRLDRYQQMIVVKKALSEKSEYEIAAEEGGSHQKYGNAFRKAVKLTKKRFRREI